MRALVALVGVLLLLGAGDGGGGASALPPRFFDVADLDGFYFRHQLGPKDTLGGWPGAALFDYDGDGDLDIYITNGDGSPNALFRNELVPVGQLQFVEVASQAGVATRVPSHGVAYGDVDNDGDEDLYVTVDGPNVLYRNNGDGTFTDVTARAGVAGSPEANSSAALFADFDLDGFLDLFVANFLPFDAYLRGERRPAPNRLYRNDGDGTFTDVTTEVGGVGELPSWAAIASDFDGDGDLDLLVGNSEGPLQIFRNELRPRGELRFTDVTETAFGATRGAWMGLAAGDYDKDLDLDYYVTNVGVEFEGDPLYPDPLHVLLRNSGDGTFRDVGGAAGVARWEFGWGTAFLDYDHDGDLDLYFAGNFGPTGKLGNPSHLFHNNGADSPRRFTDVARRVGIALEGRDSRGVAVGDIDQNGFLDILVVNAALRQPDGTVRPGVPALYLNEGNEGHWLKVKLIGTQSNRDAIGARVIVRAGPLVQMREKSAGGSFLSQGSPILHFGLGNVLRVDELEVRWPGGRIQIVRDLPVDRQATIREESEP